LFVAKSGLSIVAAAGEVTSSGPLERRPAIRWEERSTLASQSAKATYHENLGEAAVIATSLEELVRRALSCPDGLYWLEPAFRPYRRLKYENPPRFWRRSHGEWYATLGEERGPERCAADDCGRLRIAHSVMCRKHHYEMVHRRRSPFGDD
jgi:hypothetical protein